MSETQTTHLSSLKDICRCCHSDGNFYSLKEPYKFKGKVEVYYRMLIETFGILISPPTIEVSYTICDDCIIRLRDSTIFRNQVEACEEKFNQYSQIFFKPVDKNDADAETMVELKKEHNYFENVDDTVNVDDHVENVDNEDYENITVTKIEDGVSNVVEVQDDDVEESEGTNIEYERKNVNETDDIGEKVENLKMKIEDKDDDLHNAENGVDPLKKNSSRLKNENMVGCVFCRKKFISKDLLKIHIKEHLNRKYKCTDCEHSFVCLARLKIHSRTIHNKPISFEEDIKSVQDNNFKYKANRTIEDKPEKLFENHLEFENDKVCEDASILKKENKKKERDNNNQQESFECQICKKKYSTLQKMLNHKHRKHQKKSLFICDMCQKEFLHKNSLQKHIGWHNGINKKFMCEICGYSFHDKTNLNVHFRAVHQKLKLYKCTVCPKKFAANKNLKIHFRLHSGERPYTCDVCHEGFICSTYLVKHKEKHDNIKKYGGKYICKVCNTVFNERHMFTAHMRSHVGVKPYRCNYCEKDFFSHFSLKRHNENQHMNDARLGCKNCDAYFCEKSKLQMHFNEKKDLACDEHEIKLKNPTKNNKTEKGCRYELDKRSRKNK